MMEFFHTFIILAPAEYVEEDVLMLDAERDQDRRDHRPGCRDDCKSDDDAQERLAVTFQFFHLICRLVGNAPEVNHHRADIQEHDRKEDKQQDQSVLDHICNQLHEILERAHLRSLAFGAAALRNDSFVGNGISDRCRAS